MTRSSSVKEASRRWPMHVFYNIIDSSLINAHILYSKVCNLKMSRRSFIEKVSLELTGNADQDESELENISSKRLRTDNDSSSSTLKTSRKKCTVSTKCKNRTAVTCAICKKNVCGTHSIVYCPSCTEN